jgi:hypothetical protein
MLMGMFPAAALSFRRGDLEQGPVVAHEQRTPGSLYERQPPRLDDNEIYGVSRETEELKSPTRAGGRPSRAVFLVGRVTSEIKEQGDGEQPLLNPDIDLASYLSPNEGSIRSATGQIEWNYKKGICTINAGKTQGVTGFLRSAGGSFSLSDVVIESSNVYASVWVVSLDDKPLRESRSVLIQVGTAERLTGWQTRPDELDWNGNSIKGLRIVNSGRPPLRVANAHVRLKIDNPHLAECVVLDSGGYLRKTIALAPRGGEVSVDFPSDAMYAVLREPGANAQLSNKSTSE